ncbi:C40 family peptidase [Streptomyces sp. NBC_00154]|uniref:C40 family peptidase n=1 Tax=Streptomyces sp. NBC_00154 TaxID=2975670 RepID=UPI002255412A|nr:C40 family peptidase [Streptomyces sp. NBC_00154]MCX5317945.1 NlpC/P60 family protein [Streptomyces sp. NBC_00154]
MTQKNKKWLAGGTGLILLAIVLLAAIAAHVADIGQSEAEAAAAQAQCAANGTGGDVDTAQVAQQVKAVLAGSSSDVTVASLPSPKEQIPNAKAIVATGAQMRIPARGQVIALATALQESGLRNLDHGDRDSVGLFQQRPSQGWGSRAQILDPVYAATKFYKALKSLKDWESMPVTVAAQKVQKSGVPDAYAKHEALATALQQAVAPTLGTAAAIPGITPAVADFGAGCVTQAGTDYGDIPAGTLPEGYQIPITAPIQARNAIRWALGQLGTPYQWGGTCTNPHGSNARDRCDCSSLMQRAYGVAGVEITRTTYTQIHDGRAVSAKALQPGDLVFTNGSASRPEHVAMFLGDGLVVHAPRPGRVVEVAELATHGTILVARRIAP